jgi:hypothetical protein
VAADMKPHEVRVADREETFQMHRFEQTVKSLVDRWYVVVAISLFAICNAVLVDLMDNRPLKYIEHQRSWQASVVITVLRIGGSVGVLYGVDKAPKDPTCTFSLRNARVFGHMISATFPIAGLLLQIHFEGIAGTFAKNQSLPPLGLALVVKPTIILCYSSL